MTDSTSHLNGPFRLIPPELHAKIFKHAISTDTHALEHEPQLRGLPLITTPLTLGAVCRSWRSVVWDTPSLWTVIVVLLSYDRYKAQLAILDLWLRNSGSCQLDIWFDVNFEFYDNRMDPPYPDLTRWGLIVPALKKLVDECQRWRGFSILISSTLIEVLSQVHGNVQLLQAVCMQWAEESYQFPWTVTTNHYLCMFEKAPLLKHFTLVAESDLPALDCVSINWSQLISIRASIFEEASWDNLLFQCTNIVECNIVSTGCYFPEDDYGITFPYLSSLEIMEAADCSERIGKTLQSIRCPELRRLHLRTRYQQNVPLHWQDLDDFIYRSDCVVESLYLTGMYVNSRILRSLAKILTLKCLAMDVRNDGYFLYSLITTLDLKANPSKTFLPNLKELRFKDFPIYASPPLISLGLLKVVQQRWNPPEGVSKLKTVVIEDVLTLDATRDGYVIAGLGALKREGMQISVPGL